MTWRNPPPAFSEADFQRFRALILDRTGLVFDHKRFDLVAQALAEGSRQAGELNLDRYFSLLAAHSTHGPVWEPLVSALTVNETYFFRDAEQISVLHQQVLPEVIARRRDRRRLRLWSAGCATGEEPYTLAILLHQLLPDLDGWEVLILATDIDYQVLRRAETASYRDWSFRDTDPAIRQSYFSENGESLELLPQLRRLVRFAYLNLADDAYPTPAHPCYDFDLILCRNVAIYLQEPVIRAIAGRFHQCLTPGGWLMVGASETNDQRYRPFQAVNLHGITVYRKAAEGAETTRIAPPAPRAIPTALPSLGHSIFSKELPPPFEKGGSGGILGSGIDPPNSNPPSPPFAKGGELHCRNQPAASPSSPDLFPPDAIACYRQGEDCLHRRQLAEARRWFEACLAQQPKHDAACRQLARMEANAGRLTEARHWAEQALQQEPLHDESHYLLALIEQEQGEIEAALARFKKVLYLAPDFVLAHIHLSDLYRKQGQPVAAARHRAQALRLCERLPADAVLPGSDDLTAGQAPVLLHSLG
jgi:chemotaxis protein methyltransferase CheR